MEPSAKLLDDIKVRGNTLKTDTLGRFQNAAQRAKNFLLGPPPPQPQLRRRQRREYVKRVKSDTPEVPMAVYSGGESREYEEIFMSEEKTPLAPAQTATPDPEPVYSDLNLPELIDDVRRLREEIMGARVDLRTKKKSDQWRLVELFMRVTAITVFISFVLVCARSDDKLVF